MPYGRWWFRISLEELEDRVEGAVAMRHGIVVGRQPRGQGEIIIMIVDKIIAGMSLCLDWSGFN